jgi:hypothetical protein
MAGCHADIRVSDSFSQVCEDSLCQALQFPGRMTKTGAVKPSSLTKAHDTSWRRTKKGCSTQAHGNGLPGLVRALGKHIDTPTRVPALPLVRSPCTYLRKDVSTWLMTPRSSSIFRHTNGHGFRHRLPSAHQHGHINTPACRNRATLCLAGNNALESVAARTYHLNDGRYSRCQRSKTCLQPLKSSLQPGLRAVR